MAWRPVPPRYGWRMGWEHEIAELRRRQQLAAHVAAARGRNAALQAEFPFNLRGLLRQIEIRTAGTAATPNVSETTPAWGFAGMARLPMRFLAEAFGQDDIAVRAFYGQGIGRYFAGQTSGQDAVTNLGLNGREIPMVKGDATSYAIAASSIVAKVTRDRQMLELDKQYPQYGFARNKGYGTPEHIAALQKYGATPLHRRTFIGHFVPVEAE